jgi:TolB-like protein
MALAKRALFMVAAVGLLSGAAQAAAKRPRVVVLSIKPIDAETAKPAQVLTEIILTDLSKLNRLDILGETEISSLLGFERQKQLMGCTEGSCLAEIGGALGCDLLVMGTLGRVGKQLRLDLKLADARKNAILVRDGALVSPTDDLVDAARRSLTAIVAAIPAPKLDTAVALKPAEPAPAGSVEPQARPEEPTAVKAATTGGRGPLPWILIGGGAAVAAGGAVLTGVSVYNKRRLTFDVAQTRTTAGNVMMGVGVAAAVAGVVVYALTGSSAAPAQATVTLAPSTQGPVLMASGSF